MTSFSEGLTNGLRGAACTLVGGQPEWFRQYTDWGTPSGLLPITRGLRRWVCGADPEEEPDLPDPPFSGGQCPTVYLVTLVETTGAVGFPLEAFATGPISGVIVLPGVLPGTNFYEIDAASNVTFRTGNAGENWVIQSVSRVDSGPDDCGDPPLILPPPGPVNVNVDITYGDNNEFNLTVPVIFAPLYIALDGSINVPITVNLEAGFELNGTLELFPDFEFKPEINFGGDTGDGQPDPQPPPDSPDGEGEGGEDDPDTPEDPEPRVYGLLCRARIESEARPSGIFQEIGPDIYAPRLGSARFGTLIGNVVFWSEDIDIKGLNSVIQCPIPWGASHFVVNAADGVVVNYTPISSAPKEWPTFLGLGSQFTSDSR